MKNSESERKKQKKKIRKKKHGKKREIRSTIDIYISIIDGNICFSKIFSLIQQLIRKHFSVLAESASKIENSKCSPRISILILANFAPINQFLIVYSIFHPLWIALYCLYLQLQFFSRDS